MVIVLSNQKYSFLDEFFKGLNKFNKLKTQKEKTKTKKINVCDAASELYNEMLEACFDEYNELSDAKRENIKLNYDPVNYILLMHIITITGLKMKNRLIKKNLQIYRTCHH